MKHLFFAIPIMLFSTPSFADVKCTAEELEQKHRDGTATEQEEMRWQYIHMDDYPRFSDQGMDELSRKIFENKADEHEKSLWSYKEDIDRNILTRHELEEAFKAFPKWIYQNMDFFPNFSDEQMQNLSIRIYKETANDIDKLMWSFYQDKPSILTMTELIEYSKHPKPVASSPTIQQPKDPFKKEREIIFCGMNIGYFAPGAYYLCYGSLTTLLTCLASPGTCWAPMIAVTGMCGLSYYNIKGIIHNCMK